MDDEQKKTRILGLLRIAYQYGRNDEMDKCYPEVGIDLPTKNWEYRKLKFWKQINDMFKKEKE